MFSRTRKRNELWKTKGLRDFRDIEIIFESWTWRSCVCKTVWMLYRTCSFHELMCDDLQLSLIHILCVCVCVCVCVRERESMRVYMLYLYLIVYFIFCINRVVLELKHFSLTKRPIKYFQYKCFCNFSSKTEVVKRISI